VVRPGWQKDVTVFNAELLPFRGERIMLPRARLRARQTPESTAAAAASPQQMEEDLIPAVILIPRVDVQPTQEAALPEAKRRRRDGAYAGAILSTWQLARSQAGDNNPLMLDNTTFQDNLQGWEHDASLPVTMYYIWLPMATGMAAAAAVSLGRLADPPTKEAQEAMLASLETTMQLAAATTSQHLRQQLGALMNVASQVMLQDDTGASTEEVTEVAVAAPVQKPVSLPGVSASGSGRVLPEPGPALPAEAPADTQGSVDRVYTGEGELHGELHWWREFLAVMPLVSCFS